MRLASLVMATALLSACAASPPRPKPPFIDPALNAEAASGRVTPGQTTKAQVRAALGEPEAVPFDSGYEVWVYRTQRREGPGDELVLLFDPSGVLTKQRVRIAPAPAAR